MLNNTEAVRRPYNQTKAAGSGAGEYELLYPEIYYQMQPYIIEACDQLDAAGVAMPTAEILSVVGDRIEKRFEVPGTSGMKQAVPDSTPAALRSRGLFRDLLDILILNELFGRRRRYYY